MTGSRGLYKGFLGIALFGLVSFLLTFQIHHSEQQVADPPANSLSSVLQQSKVAAAKQRVAQPPVPESKPKESVLQQSKVAAQPPVPESKPKETTSSDIPDYHVVFSTSCEDQQNWESYVFFFHAWKVGQRGTVTRITSGCSEEERKELQEFHKKHIATLNPNFFLHLTPDFSRDSEYIRYGKARYKYMNKPFGLLHWMESTFGLNGTTYDRKVEDGIVILMDPDMILLRPIVHDYSNQNVLFAEDNPATKVVKHGFPMAQQDGYLSNLWMFLNASYITNGGNISHIKTTDGPKHYNTGPPYLFTLADGVKIARKWVDYAPRVYEIHPKLFAEMFGYIFATTQLNLPHTMIRSLVVSTTETEHREGWPYILDWPDDQVCLPLPATGQPFTVSQDLSSTTPLPVALHYCKRYLLEKWFFSKYRLKKHYISCETPLLQMPPEDLALRNYTRSLQPPPHGYYHQNPKTPWDPPVGDLTRPGRAKKEAFMVCQMIRAVNEAAEYFKKTACDPAKTNWDRNYTFFNDPDH